MLCRPSASSESASLLCNPSSPALRSQSATSSWLPHDPRGGSNCCTSTTSTSTVACRQIANLAVPLLLLHAVTEHCCLRTVLFETHLPLQQANEPATLSGCQKQRQRLDTVVFLSVCVMLCPLCMSHITRYMETCGCFCAVRQRVSNLAVVYHGCVTHSQRCRATSTCMLGNGMSCQIPQKQKMVFLLMHSIAARHKLCTCTAICSSIL